MNTPCIDSLEELRSVMRVLRSRTPVIPHPLDRAASSDVRTGYIASRPVRRLVITFRAPGCAWISRGGGCVMCGHYAGTTRGVKPSVDDAVAQFLSEAARYDLTSIEVLSLYNSGSILNPDEFPPEALDRIFSLIAKVPSIGKVVLETRAEYVDPRRAAGLLDILGPGKRLSVAIGLETANDMKRELCVNKGCSLRVIRQAVDSIRGIAEIQLYVLLGIPFLTETEMIGDAVETIRCAHDMSADEIHIEPATIQRHTLMYLLERENLYRLPSLYSLYEVLRAVLPDIRPYVSPFMHMPPPERIPEGCPECTERLIEGLLGRYNIERTVDALRYDPCECLETWKERLAVRDTRPLRQRVEEALAKLACGVMP